MTIPSTSAIAMTTSGKEAGRRSAVQAAFSSIGTAIASIATIIALWWLVLILFSVPAFVGKTPYDVWVFLVSAPAAADNRSFVGEMLAETLIDASLGLAAGLGVAFLLAAIFQVVRGVEHTLMPIALLLQSVPLIAIAPIIIMIFGRDMATTAVMGGIVVLFPALVTIVFGLRSATPQMLDLVAVFGGSATTTLRMVSIPAAIPALFATVRISIPGAITGAMIAEWLATGRGMGYAIVAAVGSSQMSLVWTLAVVATAVSLTIYMAVSVVERVVLARIGMPPTN